MSFFPRGFYEADASSFTPLFRLLDDFDSYTRQAGGQPNGRRAGAPIWQPKFDVRETDDAYELHGELPGMNKDTVHIEFTEPQTMSVRGRAERSYSEGTPSAGQIEDVTEKPAITQGGEGSHKATVEDEGAAAGEGAVEPAQAKPQAPKYKYWLTERSVGEFSRTFNFPTPVQHDAVSASFKDGILSVSVPKAKKPEARRVTIS
ncbi:heat shock protein 30, partial [Metarhizium majus ARSEF 297]